MVKRATGRSTTRLPRQRRKIILIASEGTNKTETSYFGVFNRLESDYHIIFASGNNTDPIKIVKDAINSAKKNDVSNKRGDIIIAVCDTDFHKEEKIAEARKIAEKHGVLLILSNPCFELWILLHFKYSTRSYSSNEDVFRALTNRWPQYKKNTKSFDNLIERYSIAVENAKQLKRHHEDINTGTLIEERNPSTDVYKVVELLLEQGGDDNNSK